MIRKVELADAITSIDHDLTMLAIRVAELERRYQESTDNNVTVKCCKKPKKVGRK